jgi:hypothetical protein
MSNWNTITKKKRERKIKDSDYKDFNNPYSTLTVRDVVFKDEENPTEKNEKNEKNAKKEIKKVITTETLVFKENENEKVENEKKEKVVIEKKEISTVQEVKITKTEFEDTISIVEKNFKKKTSQIRDFMGWFDQKYKNIKYFNPQNNSKEPLKFVKFDPIFKNFITSVEDENDVIEIFFFMLKNIYDSEGLEIRQNGSIGYKIGLQIYLKDKLDIIVKKMKDIFKIFKNKGKKNFSWIFDQMIENNVVLSFIGIVIK